MRFVPSSVAARALVAGALCLVVLGGMAVGHAWPLWTGRDVLMPATISGASHRSASGEYLQLSVPAELLKVSDAVRTATPDMNEWQRADIEAEAKLPWVRVRTVAPWPEDALANNTPGRELRGRTIYVQLEPRDGGEHVPVSISLAPVAGAVNLRGVVSRAAWGRVRVQYGLDAFFLGGDRAAEIRKSSAAKPRVQVRVAITESGRARIRDLLIDGVRVE